MADPTFNRPAGIANIGEWVDFSRRVQTPYYEEARPHFTDEVTRQQVGDGNEVTPYVPTTLERIANGYEDS